MKGKQTIAAKAKHVMTWNAHWDTLLASDTQQDIERYTNRLAK